MIVIAVVLLVAGVEDAPPAADDPVQRVAQALADGAAAETKRNPRKLAAAAQALDLLGARPTEGSENAAQQFRTRAEAAGFKTTPPFRGRALGPAYSQGTLAPGASLATSQIFLAGQKAVVALVPDRGGKLAIRVGEAGGTAICERSIAPPRGGCSWMPVFTRRVEIRVSNPDRRPVRYWLVSN